MKLKQIGSNQTELQFESGVRVLVSYETPVAAYVPGRGYVRTDRDFSRTTARHISAFAGKDAPRVPHADILRLANNDSRPRFVIHGRRWFQKSAGNTYHSVTINDAEGNQVGYIPMSYGYDDQYLQTALAWLHAQGLIAAPEGPGSLFCRENGIEYSVSDVSRQRDL